jgi:peptide/nickel transport system permease protein
MQLAFMTIVCAVLWSVPLGIISAVCQDTWGDYIVRVVSISGLCIPAFFAGVLLLFVLVRFFHWMPPLEFTAFIDNPTENLKQLIWPAPAQAFYISTPITRLTRSLMREVVRKIIYAQRAPRACQSALWSISTPCATCSLAPAYASHWVLPAG